MAIYEYRCTNEDCKHEFEARQKMSDDPLTQCPKCLKESLQKLISKSSFKLKGNWFRNNGEY